VAVKAAAAVVVEVGRGAADVPIAPIGSAVAVIATAIPMVEDRCKRTMAIYRKVETT
jgi:hypothetical protein